MKRLFGTLLLCAFVAVSSAQASKTVVHPNARQNNKAAQKQAKQMKKQQAKAQKAAKSRKAKVRKAV